jgi:hypothetical protein
MGRQLLAPCPKTQARSRLRKVGGLLVFERFTESARRSIFVARYEAAPFGSQNKVSLRNRVVPVCLEPSGHRVVEAAPLTSARR